MASAALKPSGVLQPAEAERRVHDVEQRKHGGAEGYRYAYAQQVLKYLPAAVRRISCFYDSCVIASFIYEHVGERRQRTDRDAEDGAGGDYGEALADVLKPDGKCKPGEDLKEHLEYLADCGGLHVLVALAIAAVGAGQADEQQRRGEGLNALRSARVAEQHRKLGGVKEHDERADEAQHEECTPRYGEGTLHLRRAVHGVGLGYHPRERHGQARGRKREENTVDVVGHEKMRHTGIAEDIPKRYLVYCAEYFDDDNAGRKYRSAVQVVLLFGF